MSLDGNCRVDREVIVVDGGSFDGCAEMITSEFPHVLFIQSEENIGFGRCNNLGAIRARGKFLLFLNPDTEVRRGAMEALLDVIENDSRVGLVGARLLSADGTLQGSSVHALPTPLNRALDSEFLRRRLPFSCLWENAFVMPIDRPVSVEAISGACMLVRRQTFERVGGFSAEYFMYGEDMQLCADVSNLGMSVVYQPVAAIVHHGGGSTTGDFSRFAAVEMSRSVHHFIIRNQGIVAGIAFRTLMFLSSGCRLVMLGGACLFAGAGRRMVLKRSLQKWWSNLNWAVYPWPRAFVDKMKA
jgi:GT2 family glycosyltransferase